MDGGQVRAALEPTDGPSATSEPGQLLKAVREARGGSIPDDACGGFHSTTEFVTVRPEIVSWTPRPTAPRGPHPEGQAESIRCDWGNADSVEVLRPRRPRYGCTESLKLNLNLSLSLSLSLNGATLLNPRRYQNPCLIPRSRHSGASKRLKSKPRRPRGI